MNVLGGWNDIEVLTDCAYAYKNAIMELNFVHPNFKWFMIRELDIIILLKH